MIEPSSKTQPVRFPMTGHNLVNSFSFAMGFEVQPLPLKENLYVKARLSHSAGELYTSPGSLLSPSQIVAMVLSVFLVLVFRKIAIKIPCF